MAELNVVKSVAGSKSASSAHGSTTASAAPNAAAHATLRNTYRLLSMTLAFSAVVAATSAALQLPYPGLLLALAGWLAMRKKASFGQPQHDGSRPAGLRHMKRPCDILRNALSLADHTDPLYERTKQTFGFNFLERLAIFRIGSRQTEKQHHRR